MFEYHKLLLCEIGAIITTVGTYHASGALGTSHMLATVLAVVAAIFVAGISAFAAMHDGEHLGLTIFGALFVVFYGCGFAIIVLFVACDIILPYCSPHAKFNAAGILILCAMTMIGVGALISIKESVPHTAAITTGGITLAGIIASLAIESVIPGFAAIGLLGLLAFKVNWD